MFDRLLVYTIVAFSLVPANAAAQIVIEGSDGRAIEQDEDSESSSEGGADEGDEADEPGDAEGDEAPDDAETSDGDEASDEDDGALTIEGYGKEEKTGEEPEASPNQPQPSDDESLAPEEVRSAIDTAVANLLTQCVAATQRPQKHDLRATFVATEPPAGVVETQQASLVARAAKLEFADAMLLSEEESALPAAKVAGRVKERRATFEECADEVDVPLEAAPPAGKWQVKFELEWVPLEETAKLRNVRWSP